MMALVTRSCAHVGQIHCYGKSSINGTWNFLNSIIQFSGCNQGVAVYHPPSQSPTVMTCLLWRVWGMASALHRFCVNVDMENSQVLYNTQDGEDFGHRGWRQLGHRGNKDQSSVSMLLKNNFAYANEGSGFKIGPQFNPQTLQGNVSRR